MNSIKKIVASVLVATTLFSFTSCGADKSWTYKLEDYVVTSGMYVGMSLAAYDEATALEGYDVYKTAFDQELEGKDGLQWVKDEAEKLAKRYLAIEQKFDEMGFTIDSDTKSYLNSSSESYYNYYDQVYQYADKGFGLESFSTMQLNQYKSSTIFNSIYGQGGTEEVAEDVLKEAFYEANAKVCYIPVRTSVTDEEGNSTKLEQADIEAEAEALKKRFENGEDFQKILNDYYKDEETIPEASRYTVIIDKNDSTNNPENILEFVKNGKAGDVAFINDATMPLVMKIYDIKADKTDFENNRMSVLSKLKTEEFEAKVDEWANALTVEANESSLKKHSPKNIKIEPLEAPDEPESEEASSEVTEETTESTAE